MTRETNATSRMRGLINLDLASRENLSPNTSFIWFQGKRIRRNTELQAVLFGRDARRGWIRD